MAQKRKSMGDAGDLFIEGLGQLRMIDKSGEQQALEKGKVECLGMTFDSEDARRAYYTELLREKLADPEFRKTPGFPKGTDEDIVRMSDPPWYTACPNPFLADFVRVYGKPHDPKERYARDPFAVDVSVGKSDPIYKAHSYHTKVPHLAIVPSILHYTEPGDIVLDGFSGSGMTGVAAQYCGSAPASYRKDLENDWQKNGHPKPRWGVRRAVLSDLSPVASFISANYVTPLAVAGFAREAKRILAEIDHEIGWMYETLHSDGRTKGKINYTVWSELFSCPECAGEINFLEAALDQKTMKILGSFRCPHCDAGLSKDNMERSFETVIDDVTKEPWKRLRFKPYKINYKIGKSRFDKNLDQSDFFVLDKISKLKLPHDMPSTEFPIDEMYHGSRLAPKGVTRIHHLFVPRAAHALALFWRKANAVTDKRTRDFLIFALEPSIPGMSLMNRHHVLGRANVNQQLTGVYYIPSVHEETSLFRNIEGKLERLESAFSEFRGTSRNVAISCGDCANIPISDETIDYVFTDPPFGENIFYADLNFLIEAWHRVVTDVIPEAIVDRPKQKNIASYQSLMRACFEEYARVLKPGRWMTVVFSNSSNAVWRAIQEALGTAGFVVADVRTLDKQQGSYRQITSTAVKQDLVISAYKPTGELTERFSLGKSSPESAWAFISEHLAHVPIFTSVDGVADVIAERMAQVLHDRMIAFHVQRQLSVPLSTAEFLGGLNQRYPERDGMYFLPTQVAEYDRKRNTAAELRQLSLFVTDEASAIQWVRRELQDKPRSFQDLQPVFMREIQSWAKHEQTVELKEILRQNCIHYDGNGPVPSQIHSYLSTNFKELRNLAKDDLALTSKAADRWYVPDPAKQGDLEKLREKALLTEFETYKSAKERKLKLFRTEAVRAGFKVAYEGQDYKTIVSVAAKLPENVLQEDEKLLMYYDVASMRLGDE